MAFFTQLADAAGPAGYWLAHLVAGALATLVIYVGVALIASLTSKDMDARRHARAVLCDLLSVFRRIR